MRRRRRCQKHDPAASWGDPLSPGCALHVARNRSASAGLFPGVAMNLADRFTVMLSAPLTAGHWSVEMAASHAVDRLPQPTWLLRPELMFAV